MLTFKRIKIGQSKIEIPAKDTTLVAFYAICLPCERGSKTSKTRVKMKGVKNAYNITHRDLATHLGQKKE